MPLTFFEKQLADAMALQRPFEPLVNLAAPGAATGILDGAAGRDAVTPDAVEIWGITVALAVESVFNLSMDDGSGAVKVSFNNGVALPALMLHTFVVAVMPGVEYDFEVVTDGIIRMLIGTKARTGASH